MEIAAAIIGVILGFLLSEIAQWLRSLHADGKELRAAHAFISIEIQHNLSVLSDIRQAILAGSDDIHERVELHRCLRFITLPFPEFHDRAFLTQMSILSSTLDTKVAAKLLRHYDKINALNNLRQIMVGTKSREDHAWIVASGGRTSVKCGGFGDGPSLPFQSTANDFWQQLESLFIDIEQNGNPMK